jgi:hypothetical protein
MRIDYFIDVYIMLPLEFNIGPPLHTNHSPLIPDSNLVYITLEPIKKGTLKKSDLKFNLQTHKYYFPKGLYQS